MFKFKIPLATEIAIVALIFLSAFTSHSAIISNAEAGTAPTWTVPIVGGIDGDTIATTVPLMCPLCKASVRIRGIDTPESTALAKCELEKTRGKAAKVFTAELIGQNKTMILKDFKWDKYGGRIDANVTINGVDVAQTLISKGYAKPYTGRGPKPDWCSE